MWKVGLRRKMMDLVCMNNGAIRIPLPIGTIDIVKSIIPIPFNEPVVCFNNQFKMCFIDETPEGAEGSQGRWSLLIGNSLT